MRSEMKRLLLGFVGVILVCRVVAAATIGSIEVESVGPGRADPTFVKAHVQLEPGDGFSAAVAAQDVKRLLETERFTDVRVDVRNPREAEVEVVYTVQPRLRLVGTPSIEGNQVLRDRKVRNELDLNRGDLVDDQVVAVAVQRLLDVYREKHYRQARVDWNLAVTNAERGLATLSVVIDEGQRELVRGIDVAGNTVLSDSDLKRELKLPWILNPYRWFVPRRYGFVDLEEVESDVLGAYLDAGYLDAKVDVSVKTKADGGRRAQVEILEGALYRIGQVVIEGVTLFPEAAIRDQIRLQSGAVASIGAIESAARAVQAYYGNQGYLATVVRPVLTPDMSALTLDVRFRVREGERVSIRNIVIEGNSRTRDKVIRRELLVYPGEVYNQARVERSQRRLQNLGFFESVRVLPRATGRESERDLVFATTEKRTGQFMVGAGFSSVDDLLGFVELSQGNFDLLGWPYFTGGGQKLRLRAQMGSTRSDYRLTFTEPWFLDRRLALGLDVYRRERDFDEYDLKSTGFSVSIGKSLPLASRLNVRYTLEQTEVTDVGDTNTYFFLDTFDFASQTGEPYSFENEEDRISSSLSLSLSQDTRNNPFVPTRGFRWSLYYTLTGGIMGFDTDIYNVGFQHTGYLPLWLGHVLSLRTEVEFVDAFDDTDEVPLADRLFLGGGRTLRGYEFRDVGPKVIRPLGDDDYFHRPYGGLSLFSANLEYTIPIVDALRFGIFYDIGNVWSDRFSVDFDDLASSAGIGLRIDMPGFPIRVDRAWPVDPDDDFTDEDAWSIYIGYDY